MIVARDRARVVTGDATPPQKGFTALLVSHIKVQFEIPAVLRMLDLQHQLGAL